MHQNPLPKTTSIPTTISYISQITNNLPQIDEINLQKLDECILNYLTSRNIQKGKKNNDGYLFQEVNVNKIDVLSIAGLNCIHGQCQDVVLELEKQMSDFYVKRSYMEENNVRIVNQFLDGKEGIGIFQLCKMLIIQLSKFQNIESFCHKLAECRKKSSQPMSADLATEVEKYLSRVDGFIYHSDSEDSGSDMDSNQQNDLNHYTRIGKNGKIKHLLDFIQ